MNKNKKLDKKIFEKLRETLNSNELSTNKGEFDKTKNKKPNSKTRRHSGRKEIFVDDEDYPYQEMFYDIWNRYDDGLKNPDVIKTKEIKKIISKEQKIRKAKKNKGFLNT